ncbi:glucose-methanol-choline (gmc) oxidoreductase [Nasonia vitripennis]|uniref:Glucose-methanol-choline oxidoreductase N-terminal domain-containing protein n=1 Tax=Nasonia vitripennis TaxID=7425 RepID=A0A7M6UF26_NASVI|nr:glucose-methanol-choline (gmc) oxidoreductase [Nasonia vitripennis]
MVSLKFLCFVINSVAVTFFMYYLNISYLYHFYEDWLFCDFKNSSKYDYIIVGAGSAGSILAKRLADAGANILLVEAGGVPSYFFNIPILTPLFLNTVYDWQYVTVPQENACKGLINNQSAWPAGRILGGSSRLNNMIYVRGHPKDYDPWFLDYEDPTVGNGGPLYVNDQTLHSELSDAILKGVRQLLYPIGNINEELSTGFMKVQLTIKDGERWSTDRILYGNRKKRLRIMINSLVHKILFQGSKAVGIQFSRQRQTFKALASKGVIVSAGAVGSPKLLMLSGVGPKEHLNNLKIQTVADLPVGHNLMDHLITGLDLITLKKNIAMSIVDLLNPYSMLEYYLHGTGPWTSGGVNVLGTFHSKFQKDMLSEPDLQIMTFPVGISQDNGILMKKNLRIIDETYDEYFAPLAYQTTISVAPVLLHPKSKGEIRLKSPDPFDAPVIDPKYLSNEEDLLKLIDGIYFVKKLIKTDAMKKLGAELYKKPFPGCENIVFDTLEYWKCYVSHLTMTTYHFAGTCQMGNVVNSDFGVYKTSNLFVVDASVLPKLPSGNINAPIVMLAEKAAKLLIKHLNKGTTERLLKCNVQDLFSLLYSCY